MRLRWLRSRLREMFGLAPLPPRAGAVVPPRPRLEVDLAGAVPGAVIRILPGALALGCGLLAGAEGPGWVLTTIAAAGLVVWWPHLPVAAPFVLLLGIRVLATDDLLSARPGQTLQAWDPAALVFTVHLLLAVTVLAEDVTWLSKVERGVLLRFAGSFLSAQAAVQSLLLLVVLLRSGQMEQASAEVLRVVAVLAVVAAAFLVLPRRWLVRRRRGVSATD